MRPEQTCAFKPNTYYAAHTKHPKTPKLNLHTHHDHTYTMITVTTSFSCGSSTLNAMLSSMSSIEAPHACHNNMPSDKRDNTDGVGQRHELNRLGLTSGRKQQTKTKLWYNIPFVSSFSFSYGSPEYHQHHRRAQTLMPSSFSCRLRLCSCCSTKTTSSTPSARQHAE